MKKQRKNFYLMFFFTIWLMVNAIYGSILEANVKVNIYYRCSQDMDVILYADNGKENDSPWGEGGFCQAQQANADKKINRIQYIVPNGTENKLFISFKTNQRTDIEIYAIEIEHDEYIKRVEAEQIEKIFDNVYGRYGCYLNEKKYVYWDNIEDTFSIYSMQLAQLPKHSTMDIQKQIVCILIAFGTVAVLWMFEYILRRNRLDRKTEMMIALFSALFFATCCLWFEYIACSGFHSGTVIHLCKVAIGNVVVFLLILLCIKNLFGIRVSLVVTAGLTILLEIINYFVFILRGENFVPWDIGLTSEAVQVIDFKQLPWNKEMFIWGLVGIYIIFMICVLNKKQKTSTSMIVRVTTTFLIVLIGLGWTNYNFKYKNTYKIYQYQITESYNSSGTILSFLYFCQNAGVSKPVGYSEKNMAKIVSAYNTSEKCDTENEMIKPNIIMIMSESFWNPKILKDITYPDTFMEDYEKIEQEGTTANILSPQFGGGTCNVEFEALTGFSMDYIQNGLMPYQGLIKKDFWSIAQYLVENGYNTIAMHPNSGDYYNREKVYNNLGFKETIFGDEFEQDIVRGWVISDNAVMNKIEEIYSETLDKDEPQFIFAVTIQNHQPYSAGTYSKEDQVEISAPGIDSELKDQLVDFSTGIDNSSKALGQFVNYLKKSDRPAILIYWGDHMTNIGEERYEVFYKEGYMDEDDDGNHRMYLTQMVVWDNYLGKSGNLNELSTFQILPTVFELYDLEMPDYFKMILNLQNTSRGRSHNKLVLDENGAECKDITEKIKEGYSAMELVEYDYVYGKRYAEEMFE